MLYHSYFMLYNSYYMHIYIYIYVCVYIYIYIFMYICSIMLYADQYDIMILSCIV